MDRRTRLVRGSAARNPSTAWRSASAPARAMTVSMTRLPEAIIRSTRAARSPARASRRCVNIVENSSRLSASMVANCGTSPKRTSRVSISAASIVCVASQPAGSSAAISPELARCESTARAAANAADCSPTRRSVAWASSEARMVLRRASSVLNRPSTAVVVVVSSTSSPPTMSVRSTMRSPASSTFAEAAFTAAAVDAAVPSASASSKSAANALSEVGSLRKVRARPLRPAWAMVTRSMRVSTAA